MHPNADPEQVASLMRERFGSMRSLTRERARSYEDPALAQRRAARLLADLPEEEQ